METGNKEEVVVKAIKELVKSLTKSVKSAEWSLENGILYHRGKIYVPDLIFVATSPHSVMIPKLLAMLEGGKP